MADRQVQGDPDSMRTAGRVSANSSSVYGNQAATADSVTKTLAANKSTNNTKAMTFSQRIAAGKRQVAQAHQQVSELLPKVATAVHDAQQAETKMNDAKTKLAAATKKKAAADKALQTANTNLQSAEVNLTLAESTPLSSTPPWAGSAPAPNPLAVTAAKVALAVAKAAQAAAESADKAATVEQHTAQDNYNNDVKAFDEANTKRKAALTKLNNLYHEEAAKAQAALALLGPIPVLAASPADLNEQQQLKNEITGLQDVDRLANDGELGEHAKQVEQSFNQSTSDNADTAAQGLTLMKLWGQAYDPNSVIPTANPAFVAHTSQLIQAAARGETKAVAQLRAQSSLSQQKEFSEALLLKLGAEHLERIPLTMAEVVEEKGSDGFSDQDKSIVAADHQVLQYLGDSLASASSATDPAFTQFTQDLIRNGYNSTAEEDQNVGAAPTNPNQQGAGFWGLGQIPGAASGKVPFDPGFVGTIGTAVTAFESPYPDARRTGVLRGRPYWGPFKPAGVNNPVVAYADNLNLAPNVSENTLSQSENGQPGADPMIGLLHAASFTTASAQALLGPAANLHYAMAVGYLYENGAVLGYALDAATRAANEDQAQLAQQITANAIHTAAQDYADGTYSTNLSGLSMGLSKVLARDLPLITTELGSPGGYKPGQPVTMDGRTYLAVNPDDALQVLGSVEQDDQAYTLLKASELQLTSAQLTADAKLWKATGETSVYGRDFQSDLGSSAQAFGDLVGARQLVKQHLLDAAEQGKKNVLADLVDIGNVGALVGPGEALKWFGLAASALGTSGLNHDNPPDTATLAAAASQNDLNAQLSSLGSQILLANHVPGLSPRGVPAPKLANGQLPSGSESQASTWFNQVLIGDSSFSPGSEVALGDAISSLLTKLKGAAKPSG